MENADRKSSPADENAQIASGGTGSKQKARSKSGAGRWLILLLIFIIIGAAVGAYWYFFLRGYISTDDAYIDGDRIAVSSKILGRITQLMVDEGDTVRAGQLLVQLDTTDLHAQQEQARANLAYAQQNATLAGVSLDLAREDFNRAEVQFKEKIMATEKYDHAKRTLDMAKAKSEIAKAEITRARAALDIVSTQFQNTQIYSSRGGVVARRWVLPGDVVQPAQPIFTIFDLKNVWITANFQETKLHSIRLFAPVEISVDAYGGQKFKGKVITLPAAAASKFSLIPPNNASGNFTKVTQRVPVKISLDLSEQQDRSNFLLLPGMSVTVKIPDGGAGN